MRQMIHEFLRITDGITMGDFLGWILAAISGIIVYKLIDHFQTSMERHAMLKEVEDSFSAIYDSIIAKSNANAKGKKLEFVMVRSVLHDKCDWQVKQNIDGEMKNSHNIEDSQLYIQIRDYKENNRHYNEWISSQALHEIMLLCRRIEKMYKDKIIRRIDLSDLFREIVPLGMGGRMQFFYAYYEKYDADCVGYLVLQTIVSCNKYHNYEIVKTFVNYYQKHEEIHKFFEESIRIRPIRDFFAVKKFKRILRRFS